MKKHKLTRWMIVVALALILPACSLPKSSGALEPTTAPAPISNIFPLVSATAKIIPEQFASLSVNTAGVVADVPVSEGDFVTEGQLLIQIKGGEQAQAAVTAAQFELTNAQVALDELYENTNLFAADALNTAEDAEDALEDLLDRQLQEALALQAIADAEKAIENTQRTYTYTTNTAGQADIDAAKAQVILAEDALEDAIDDFKDYEDRNEDDITRANFLSRKSTAQQAYDDAVRRLNALEGTGSDADIAVAAANLATAKAQLSDAQRNWDRVQEGPSAGDVALLEAQIENAYRDYQIYKDGPDPDDVAVMQARIANTEAQLAAAEAALEDLQLLAPFDGVVSELNINPNEWISPGLPVIVLADLGHLKVETTDLGEIDVAQIQVGDVAVITLDALPRLELEGTVISIAPKADEGPGVNYTVTLELNEIPAELLWGMTAYIDIELDK
ncbi:MAG: HlyD family efflux transporter periplasmic adaptor subunit [Anaerolineales bacterium]|nr:HlyD family efflux transporter periplasmic adaptor subunit [Chloroflexota bacterium]MBL6980819.1 HlyD family efflux transporter periplasmic adaptor subunit [Anaerolineales bacterium]